MGIKDMFYALVLGVIITYIFTIIAFKTMWFSYVYFDGDGNAVDVLP